MEKPKRGKKGHRSMVWGCGAALLTLLCTCCMLPIGFLGGSAFLYSVSEANALTVRSTETLVIPANQDGPTLQVYNSVGETRIRGEEGIDEIVVEITKRATGFTDSRAQATLDNLEVEVRHDGDTYIVESRLNDGDARILENASVNLRITVPRRLNIEGENNVGTLSVREVRIIDRLQLHSNTGMVEFSGVIGPEGEHEISANVGGVSLQLEEGSAFTLDARADVGAIDATIDMEDEVRSPQGVGEQVEGIYNSTADDTFTATLSISTNVGSIEIHD